MSYRRNNAIVVVDMGGGHGGGIYEQLKDNEVSRRAQGHGGRVQRTRRAARFANKRTEVIWRFREALDPSQPTGSPIMPAARSDAARGPRRADLLACRAACCTSRRRWTW
jgi:hypothetical protein